MTFTNRTVVSIAAAAMLLGGSAGAFINRSMSTGPEATSQPAPVARQAAPAQFQAQQLPAEPALTPDNPYEFTTESTAVPERQVAETRQIARTSAPEPRRTSTGTASARRPRRVSSAPQQQRVYYDYTPEKPSFWKRHRDLLTVGIGAGTGAAVGGIAGGKKGAAIGALAGGGGAALYTYKIRKRN